MPSGEPLRRLYDELRGRAFERIRAGRVDLDPVLRAGLPDQRRGLTLLIRPPAVVRERVDAWLRTLRRREPAQHYYSPSELHLTVLSLFTATADFESYFGRMDDYLAAVDAAMSKAAPIRLVFRGVTASPGAVMIQGFPATRALGVLRDDLRHQLRLRGLGKGVDERYRLETAHMTVLRFRAELRHPKKFARALDNARDRRFGEMLASSFFLVENDWFMSRGATVRLKRYGTAGTPGRRPAGGR